MTVAQLVKQGSYIRAFDDAGATSPDTARTLMSLGHRHSRAFQGMRQRGVFLKTPSGAYYMVPEKASAFQRERRLALSLWMTLGAVALTLLIVLGVNRYG